MLSNLTQTLSKSVMIFHKVSFTDNLIHIGRYIIYVVLVKLTNLSLFIANINQFRFELLLCFTYLLT